MIALENIMSGLVVIDRKPEDSDENDEIVRYVDGLPQLAEAIVEVGKAATGDGPIEWIVCDGSITNQGAEVVIWSGLDPVEATRALVSSDKGAFLTAVRP